MLAENLVGADLVAVRELCRRNSPLQVLDDFHDRPAIARTVRGRFGGDAGGGVEDNGEARLQVGVHVVRAYEP